jgi:hypothetical protein
MMSTSALLQLLQANLKMRKHPTTAALHHRSASLEAATLLQGLALQLLASACC